MTSSLKTIYIAITGMLLALTSPVNGDDGIPPQVNEPSYDVPCTPSPVCEPYRGVPCNSAPYCGLICCDSCYPSSCCGELILKGDLLYWRAELCGLESAFGNTTIATTASPGIITTTVTETDEKPNAEWKPGFRVGAEIVLNCFNLEAYWTHFIGGEKFSAGDQHGEWRIKYDVFDLTSGYFYWMSPCFYFKPFVGFRGAKIHQTLDSHLLTLNTFIPPIQNTVTVTDMDDEESFWGIGPELGLEADWDLCCNFRLYGSIDVVSYYGEMKSKNYDTDTFTSTISVSNGERKACFCCIATDAAIGIRWDKCWCCSCYDMHLMLRLGLEQHRIFDFSDLGTDGTLSLDGGIFGAGIGFCF